MKKFGLFLALFAIIGFLATPAILAKGEGKKHKEIDLPIEKPKIKTIPEEEEGDDPTFYGEELDTEDSKIVYIVDYSCSMYGSRLAKAKAEVAKSINSLSSNFKFGVVGFNCSTFAWKPQLAEANAGNKGSAIGYVNSKPATSATNTGGGCMKAYQLYPDCKAFVLLTDGAPNCGPSISGSGYGSSSQHKAAIVNGRPGGSKVNVFAIQPWSGSYKQFCQSVAQATGGQYVELN